MFSGDACLGAEEAGKINRKKYAASCRVDACIASTSDVVS